MLQYNKDTKVKYLYSLSDEKARSLFRRIIHFITYQTIQLFSIDGVQMFEETAAMDY